ncbi:MAG: disulfide bond formation protein B [Actinomycetia bacterium]|nr:disulfide bond formation protein B [Actinomycetes bacterium]MCH9699968.1 disulfide bond formation protein B [Actinomycetes bacterium]MCH9762045.1 disulfide bond formation protein B [Actinomycetes bacterium]
MATGSGQDTAKAGGPAVSSTTGSRTWGFITFWGLHVWLLGYSVVFLSAFFVQFSLGEFPCPLCMLQRYGMFLCSLGALFVIMQARHGTLTASRYAQGLGMGLVGALAGSSVSLRQIALHIAPDDPGFGDPVFGLHLYTWALITFAIVMLYCGVMLMLMPAGIPTAPAPQSTPRLISTIVVWIFIVLIAANVVAIIFLQGFAWVLPDNPFSYNLIDQLGGD